MAGFGPAAGGGEHLPTLDAALGHIGDEARAGVAADELRGVLRHLDDALADRLLLAARHGREYQAVTTIFGAVADSTTRTIERGLIDEKYAAAASISASVIALMSCSFKRIGSRFRHRRCCARRS